MGIALAGMLLLFLIIPLPRFSTDYATLLLSEEGAYLNAAVSRDEQWRFEPLDSVPFNFKKSLLSFEDQYFYYHFGVNPLALVRASFQNMRQQKIVSGGSTLSMQLARLSRAGKPRNIMQKLIEMLMAVKLEFVYSKDEILMLYATHAPFGGNTVGLEAASWRYFRRSPYELSWAEAATLAVLPNAPSLIYPGKNSQLLKQKRNRLLKQLHEKKLLDNQSLALALLEPLPRPPDVSPAHAPHLMHHLIKKRGAGRFQTTLMATLQQNTNEIVAEFDAVNSGQGIHNMAALILDLRSNEVKAYVGNSPDHDNKQGESVDIIQAARSSGSILKPFLFAAAIEQGSLLPTMLLPDVPTYINGFMPQNFNRQYDGLVAADEALIRSLNIPFVLLLKQYGLAKFYDELGEMGFESFSKGADHYGLSLILGGGEVSLWELARAYSAMANSLRNTGNQLRVMEPVLIRGEVSNSKVLYNFRKGSTWITLQALRQLARPDEEAGWHYFSSSRAVSWKTGTSFGFRDAWAVGISSDHLVAVWVGNASGKGVPGLTGTSKAAPLMFRLFELLQLDQSRPEMPFEDLKRVVVCREGGYLAGQDCADRDTLWIPLMANPGLVCPFHKTIHLTEDGRYRVNSNCYDPGRMLTKKWFVVPPEYGLYYFKKNTSTRALPPFLSGCAQERQLIISYPLPGQQVYLPVDFDGHQNPLILEAAHEQYHSTINWFLEDRFVGTTKDKHQLALILPEGRHTITAVDSEANEAKVSFTVRSKIQ
jgi:penicillin-binding protein 1C